MAQCPQHTFQVLTKRSERLRQMAPQLPWPTNVWTGVSVEDQRVVSRITDLAAVPAHVRFLAIEPLLGPLDNLKLSAIDWAIVGGESGPGARPIQEAWVQSIRGQCEKSGVAFFFKQLVSISTQRVGHSTAEPMIRCPINLFYFEPHRAGLGHYYPKIPDCCMSRIHFGVS